MTEATRSAHTCVVYRMGLLDYGEAYELQKRLHCKRLAGSIPDTILLLEHPPTLTIGRSGSLENVLVSKQQLTQEGIALISIDRGGDVTYHGPGQLVGYPIMDLSCRQRDIPLYVRNIEEVLIRTLEDFFIHADRDKSHAGVWVNNEEIAAIGLSIQKWVTMHGFALNICPNLEHFSYIHPCGLPNRRATSVAEILGHGLAMDTVIDRLLAHVSTVFDITIQADSATDLIPKGTPKAGGGLVSG